MSLRINLQSILKLKLAKLKSTMSTFGMLVLHKSQHLCNRDCKGNPVSHFEHMLESGPISSKSETMLTSISLPFAVDDRIFSVAAAAGAVMTCSIS